MGEEANESKRTEDTQQKWHLEKAFEPRISRINTDDQGITELKAHTHAGELWWSDIWYVTALICADLGNPWLIPNVSFSLNTWTTEYTD